MNMTKTRFDILDSFQFKCFDGEYSYFGDDHICFRFKGIIREFADRVDDERYSSAAKRCFEMNYRQPYNQPTPEIIKGSKKFFFTDGCDPVQCVDAYFIRLIWRVLGTKAKFFVSPMRLEPVYATNGGAWDVFIMPMRYTKEVWMKYIEDVSERMMK